MTHLVFVTNASLQLCVVEWPPSHRVAKRMFKSRAVTTSHICLDNGWVGFKVVPYLSRAFAAYCMMIGRLS